MVVIRESFHGFEATLIRFHASVIVGVDSLGNGVASGSLIGHAIVRSEFRKFENLVPTGSRKSETITTESEMPGIVSLSSLVNSGLPLSATNPSLSYIKFHEPVVPNPARLPSCVSRSGEPTVSTELRSIVTLVYSETTRTRYLHDPEIVRGITIIFVGTRRIRFLDNSALPGSVTKQDAISNIVSISTGRPVGESPRKATSRTR